MNKGYGNWLIVGISYCVMNKQQRQLYTAVNCLFIINQQGDTLSLGVGVGVCRLLLAIHTTNYRAHYQYFSLRKYCAFLIISCIVVVLMFLPYT